MTVISCMRFNDKEGAMVADEQSSVMGGNFRKYDLATKVYTLVDKENEKLMIGGTGATNFLHEAYKQALSSRKPEYSAKDTLQLLSSIFIKLRRDIIDGSLISPLSSVIYLVPLKISSSLQLKREIRGPAIISLRSFIKIDERSCNVSFAEYSGFLDDKACLYASCRKFVAPVPPIINFSFSLSTKV